MERGEWEWENEEKVAEEKGEREREQITSFTHAVRMPVLPFLPSNLRHRPSAMGAAGFSPRLPETLIITSAHLASFCVFASSGPSLLLSSETHSLALGVSLAIFSKA